MYLQTFQDCEVFEVFHNEEYLELILWESGRYKGKWVCEVCFTGTFIVWVSLLCFLFPSLPSPSLSFSFLPLFLPSLFSLLNIYSDIINQLRQLGYNRGLFVCLFVYFINLYFSLILSNIFVRRGDWVRVSRSTKEELHFPCNFLSISGLSHLIYKSIDGQFCQEWINGHLYLLGYKRT